MALDGARRVDGGEAELLALPLRAVPLPCRPSANVYNTPSAIAARSPTAVSGRWGGPTAVSAPVAGSMRTSCVQPEGGQAKPQSGRALACELCWRCATVVGREEEQP